MRDADNGVDHAVGPGPLSSLWRYRLTSLVVVLVVAVLAAVGGVASRADPDAVSRIGLANPRGLSLFLGGGASSGADLGRYAAAQVRFIQGSDLLQTTSTTLGGKPTVPTLRSSLTVAASATADVITVTAKAPTTGEASRRANAVVAAYQSLTVAQGRAAVARQVGAVDVERSQLASQIAGAKATTADGRATIAAATDQLRLLAQTASDAVTQAALFGDGTTFVDTAVATRKKSAASAGLRDGALGALVGLLLAGAVGWIRTGRRREVETADDAGRLLGAPVLGEVPAVDRRKRRDLLADPATSPLPAYHAIATALGAVAPQGLFLVIGPARDDGRTSTTLGVATALAAGGTRVAVVDADLRTGRLSRLFALDPARPGLAELARGGELPAATTVVAGPDGGELSVIGTGRAVGEPAGLLRTPELHTVLKELRARFDVVLVDTPAVAWTADAFALARHASAVVAVVRRRTPGRALHELHEQIAVNGVPLLGVVFTFGTDRGSGYSSRAGRGLGRDRQQAAPEPYPAEAGPAAAVRARR